MRQSLSTWTSLGSKWGVTGSDLWYSGRGGPDGVGGGVVGCWSAAEERIRSAARMVVWGMCGILAPMRWLSRGSVRNGSFGFLRMENL